MDPIEQPQIDAEEASAEAVHKQKNAAYAVEIARQAQLADAVERTAQRTKADMMDIIKSVFGDSDTKDPDQMRILVRRIPILCTSILQMHDDISDLKETNRWSQRLIVGGIVSIIVAVVVASILK